MVRKTALLMAVLIGPVYAGTITISSTCSIYNAGVITATQTTNGDCGVSDQATGTSAGAGAFSPSITDLTLNPTFSLTGSLTGVVTSAISFALLQGSSASISVDVQDIFGTLGAPRAGYLVLDTADGGGNEFGDSSEDRGELTIQGIVGNSFSFNNGFALNNFFNWSGLRFPIELGGWYEVDLHIDSSSVAGFTEGMSDNSSSIETTFHLVEADGTTPVQLVPSPEPSTSALTTASLFGALLSLTLHRAVNRRRLTRHTRIEFTQ